MLKNFEHRKITFKIKKKKKIIIMKLHFTVMISLILTILTHAMPAGCKGFWISCLT